MKKIILTERQKKLLEDYSQYQSDDKMQLTFLSDVQPSYIELDGNIHGYEIEENTSVSIEWSLLMVTNKDGFKTKISFHQGFGTLILISDNIDIPYESRERKSITIDKSWSIVGDEDYMTSSFDFNTVTVTFDLGSKTIKI